MNTEVIVEVLAAGVCHTDLHVREGSVDLGHGKRLEYAERGVDLPKTLGHENVGRIVAVGPDVGALDMTKNYVVYPWCGCGDCDACRSGEENMCAIPRFLGIHTDGGYATHMRISHPRYLIDIGDMDPQQAAPLACSGLTTYAALRKLGDIPKEHPILIIGAGGLGLNCVELMKAQGMVGPVVVDIDPVKRAAALKAGASAVLDPNEADVLSKISKACAGAPMAAIDFVNASKTAELAFNALAKGGSLVPVGLFGGAAPWALPMITLKSVKIHGSYVGSLTEFKELMTLAKSGALSPIPIQSFPLNEADTVLNKLADGEIIGRAILA
jgi:propanol-preferring alcohol dehydrogenase